MTPRRSAESRCPTFDGGTGEPGLVSVILPTHNRAYILDRAIESVLAQTYRPLELIIVDDGSTDDTRARVERHRGGPVRYLPLPAGGVSRARNAGLAAARGEFIALLDSDDAWKPWKLAVQVSFLRRFPEIGMAWTDMEAVDPAGATVSRAYLRTYYGAYRKTRLEDWLRPMGSLGDLGDGVPETERNRRMWGGDLFSAMFFGNLVHTPTVLFRRSLLRGTGGFDESLQGSGADFDFHWRVCREAAAGFLDASAILYRIKAPDQLTRPDCYANTAQNFLTTLTRRIEEDGARIRLSASVIRRGLARAHGWLGEELFLEGGRDGATRHLFRSFLLDPRQARTAALLAASLLPYGVFRAARALKRAVRS